ncbi:MAG: hypothetical protein R3F61_20140 [Myxococcota bacterium]
MRRRPASPLLRASAGAVGTLLVACGSTAEPAPPSEPVPAQPEAEPEVELADTHELTVKIVMPESYVYKGVPMLYLDIGEEQPITLGSVQISGNEDRTYVIRRQVDPRVKLPKRVRVFLHAPADADEANPSPDDQYAEATGVVGEEFLLEASRYVPQVTLSLRPPEKPKDDPAQQVYANTKGSHHYQDEPGPEVLLRIDLEGADLKGPQQVKVRIAFDPPSSGSLEGTIEVPRLPAEIAIDVLSSRGRKHTFQVFVDAGEEGTPGHRSAHGDSMSGDRLRAVLRP